MVKSVAIFPVAMVALCVAIDWAARESLRTSVVGICLGIAVYSLIVGPTVLDDIRIKRRQRRWNRQDGDDA